MTNIILKEISDRYNHHVKTDYHIDSKGARILLTELNNDDSDTPYVEIPSNQTLSGSLVIFEPIDDYDDIKELESVGAASLIDNKENGAVQLWQVGSSEFVALSDNTIISRKEDNNDDPYFPYS